MYHRTSDFIPKQHAIWTFKLQPLTLRFRITFGQCALHLHSSSLFRNPVALIVLHNRLCEQSQLYTHPLPSLMSLFTIVGFFALTSGRCLQTIRPGTTTQTWHAHYTTTVQCVSPPYVPADLHIYSPMNDILHADNTIAFVVVRVHVPHSGDILLDAIHIVPCPGDPSLDSYDDTVPDFQFPIVYGLGIVSSPHETLPNRSTGFSIALTEYVCNANQQSNVQYVIFALYSHATKSSRSCILNWTVPQWRNTPVPAINTVIHFYSICSQISSTGQLGIEIEGITLNVVPPTQPPVTGAPVEDDGSPLKKCCFQAHTSPHQPASAYFLSQQISSPM